MSQYPVFLKREPLIWGISLSDIFKLTALLFVASIMNLPQEITLIVAILFYGGLMLTRKLFPKRHFEFLLTKKDYLPLHLSLLNKEEKLS